MLTAFQDMIKTYVFIQNTVVKNAIGENTNTPTVLDIEGILMPGGISDKEKEDKQKIFYDYKFYTFDQRPKEGDLIQNGTTTMQITHTHPRDDETGNFNFNILYLNLDK